MQNVGPNQTPRFVASDFGQLFASVSMMGLNLCVHVVNRLLHEKWKTIPKFVSGKQLLKNLTLQILNFIPVS